MVSGIIFILFLCFNKFLFVCVYCGDVVIRIFVWFKKWFLSGWYNFFKYFWWIILEWYVIIFGFDELNKERKFLVGYG